MWTVPVQRKKVFYRQFSSVNNYKSKNVLCRQVSSILQKYQISSGAQVSLDNLGYPYIIWPSQYNNNNNNNNIQYFNIIVRIVK